MFVAYAALLFTLTHWPRMSIEVEGVERPDLFIHVFAYGVWTGLLVASGLVGHWRMARTSLRAGAIGLVWSALDEWSQSIPIVQRQASWDDAIANWAGVLVATAIGLIVARTADRYRRV